jgi:hypothetical protein
MVEIREGCWVDPDEIAAVTEDLDRRYAPPRWRCTTVTLKSGAELASSLTVSSLFARLERATKAAS